MNNLLFTKIVDQSVLKAGTTLPLDVQKQLMQEIGVPLNRGEKTTIYIKVGETSYEVLLTYIEFNQTYSNRDVIQIRYAEKSPICIALNEIFKHTAEYIATNKDPNYEGKKRLEIPESESEYIEVYAVGQKTLEFKCFPKSTGNIMKAQFLKYIGEPTDLSGYQRSYKLVFYKSFFEHAKNGSVDVLELSDYFKQFYVSRKSRGLIPDANVDRIIENIESSTLNDVLNLILQNPFNAISKPGFFLMNEVGGKKRFYISPDLQRQLSEQDINQILELVDQKIVYYFSKIDKGSGMGKIKEFIERFQNEYVTAKQGTFAGHSFGNYIRNDVPSILYSTGLVNQHDYLVTGAVGQGNWATVPWVGIFDKSITTSATKGIYIVYLLSKDGSSLYLTFNQGCTDIRSSHTKKDTIQIMRDKAQEIADKIDSRGFATDFTIDLGMDLTDLAEMYAKGTIFYKEYKKGNVPGEAELEDDLAKMMQIYKDYASGSGSKKKAWLLTWNPDNWIWNGFEEMVVKTQCGTRVEESWACKDTNVSIGDRVFLALTRSGENNGIIASGYAVSEAYNLEHLREEKSAQGIAAKRIKVSFDYILNYQNQKMLAIEKLNKLFPNQVWNPQESGILINDDYLERLENEWIGLMHAGGEEEVSTKEIIANIKKYIASKGFTYEDGLVENFFLSLKSKPFVILAGTSGTGKTRLIKLFAEAVGATTANGRYQMISVRPDWSDSSDLFGHVDLNGKFIPGAVIDFVKRAELDENHPYFLCLDEMNLARVEYYLSDVLSVIETRDFNKFGKIVTDPLVTDKYYGLDVNASGKYGVVTLPENLYIIGTVNMDETTFPFSRKVLDRANTIEFSYVDVMYDFTTVTSTVNALDLPNSVMKAEYIHLAQCANYASDVNEICLTLKEINEVLKKANSHVGYRVRDEISFYMLNNIIAGLLDKNVAMDNEIMQKILPRIQGSSAAVKEMLCELFKICAGDYDGYQTDSESIHKKMFDVIGKKECKYKKSAEKIADMVRRYETDGFTQYWL